MIDPGLGWKSRIHDWAQPVAESELHLSSLEFDDPNNSFAPCSVLAGVSRKTTQSANSALESLLPPVQMSCNLAGHSRALS